MTKPDPVKLKDPRDLYPKPPFPEQQQPIPGSDRKMEPEADHGEHSYQGSGKLQGLRALVTGGDSGIGRAVALAFAREGADIGFTYLCEDEDASQTGQLVKEAGRKVISIKMNQAERRECEQAVETCVEALGGLDILVNNAGFQQTYSSLDEVPDDELSYTLKTNVEGIFHFARAALKYIPPGGSIINTTSIQAFKPGLHLAPYAATKAAIANLTLSLAEAAIEQGVRVNGVAPGPVWTPLIPSTFPSDKVPGFGEGCLLGRPAQPAELAPLYVFLASPEASFVAGEIYGATGGEKQL